jgi:hypothetical protein
MKERQMEVDINDEGFADYVSRRSMMFHQVDFWTARAGADPEEGWSEVISEVEWDVHASELRDLLAASTQRLAVNEQTRQLFLAMPRTPENMEAMLSQLAPRFSTPQTPPR